MKHPPTKWAGRVASAGLLAALTLSPLVGLPTPAAADDGDPSISTATAVSGLPSTAIKPFEGAQIDGDGEMAGITLRISSGFDAAVDQLSLTGHDGITGTYDANTGLFRLRGTASVAAYQAALRDVTYTQTTGAEGYRTFIVVAGTAIYLPETGNLYEYVEHGDGIGWPAARTEALARQFGPFTGHLANLTSASEAAVALSELTGNTWIGATDELVEGEWRWSDGPEAGQQFWQGTGSGWAVDGAYQNWAGGEPNNVIQYEYDPDSDSFECIIYGDCRVPTGDEDYAHMWLDSGQWNDLPLDARVPGYLVEYEVDDIGSVAAQVRVLIGLDTDGDLVPDFVEAEQSTDANDPDDFLDTDADGVPDSVELADGTDPDDDEDFVDSDRDGLADYVEERIGSNPLSADSDGDDVPDGVEFADGTDLTDPDSDGDDVPDGLEKAQGTSGLDPDDFLDTDADGVPDAVELAEGTSIHDAEDYLDTDNNGVSNYAQARGALPPVVNVVVPPVVPDRCQPELSADFTGSELGNSIAQLYTAYFNRAPDGPGFAYWSELAEAGLPEGTISTYFAMSDEYANTYGDPTDDAFVDLVYNNVLCRDADDDGNSYWMGLLESGEISRADLMLYFSQSIEFRTITS